MAGKDDAPDRELTERERHFCLEYITSLNQTQAAINAGYSDLGAKQRGYELMSRPHIQAEIARLKAERVERTQITADMVLERWWMIATADPNEISQHRRNACRYCHGKDHAYQWRDHFEFADALRTARDKKRTEPTDEGGYGFSANALAHPECPRCDGNGLPSTFIADTRTLSPAARMLYAGMKETKDGIEAKTHDQQAALQKVAQHIGMLKDRVEHSGKIEVEKLTDEELAAQIAAYERGDKADGPEA